MGMGNKFFDNLIYISMSIKWMTHVKNGGILELGIGIWKERLRTAKWHEKFYEQKLLLEK